MTIDTIAQEGSKNRSDVMNYDGQVTVFGEGERELNPGAIVQEGELVGYDQRGELYIFEGTPGSLENDLPSNEDGEDAFTNYNRKALDLDPVGYLDAGNLEENDESVSGDMLHELAKRNLEQSPDMKIETKEGYGMVRLVE